MLHLPSYALGRMLAVYDIAGDNVAANRHVFAARFGAALEAEVGRIFEVAPLSAAEGYFFEVISHNHEQARRAKETISRES